LLKAEYEELIDWIAFYYEEEGLSIIPLMPNDKRAAVKWEEYQRRRPTKNEIEEWWDKYWSKGYNIGIVCGEVSDNLFVLDFESQSTMLDVFSRPGDLVRSTFCVETPSGGIHVYLKSYKPVKSTKVPGILDVQGEGKYVVAPPGRARSKITGEIRQYCPMPNTPKKIMLVEDDEVVDLVVSKVRQSMPDIQVVQTGVDCMDELASKLAGKPYRGKDPPCILRILQGVPEGMRNECAIRLASWWLTFRRLKPETVWRKLCEWNQRNNPPLPESELRNVLNSETRHGYRYGCTSLSKIFCDRSRCPIKPYRFLVGWRVRRY